MKSCYRRSICWRAWFLLAFFLILQESASGQRLVFAHYMLANQDYVSHTPTGEENIASYEREIRQAQAIGIDGFALNAGGWLKEPRYIRRSSEMFEAAYRLHSGFTLLFSADMCCSNDADDILDMMRRFANNERYSTIYFKHNGRYVLTTFAGSSRGSEFWRQLRADLEHGTRPSLRVVANALQHSSGIPSSAPILVDLVPAFFWGGELPTTKDIQTGLADYGSIIEGSLYWGIAGVPGLGHSPDQIPSSRAYGTILHQAGKLYMAPICFQFWGANAGRYYEYSGYSGMRTQWMDAINVSHPDWVEIITWNDFIEGSYVSPIDDPARYAGANDLGASIAPESTLHFFHSHRGAADLLKFFIAWYKTGRQPVIRNDAIFWAYRTQLTINSSNDKRAITTFGPVASVMYVTANLTSPARLNVTIGGHTSLIALAAGSTDVQIPMTAGAAPTFELLRESSLLVQGHGDDPISETSPYPDLYYSTGSMHD
jgi:glucan endo-1,3-alpha-glucosidase